ERQAGHSGNEPAAGKGGHALPPLSCFWKTADAPTVRHRRPHWQITVLCSALFPRGSRRPLPLRAGRIRMLCPAPTVPPAVERHGIRELRQRPYGGAAHEGRGICEAPLDDGDCRGIAAVAERDEHIADEAVAARALDRRAREELAECGIVELRKVGE